MSPERVAEIAAAEAQQLNRIEEKLDEILEATRPRTITIQGIAEELGYSVSYCRSHTGLWTQPGYGSQRLTHNPITYSYVDWLAWLSEIRRHKEEWEAKSITEQGSLHRRAS